MTVEWSESHPIEQAATGGCGNKTCMNGPRMGQLCFGNADCGAGFSCSGSTPGGSACGMLTWGTTNLYAGSGVVALGLVDFNAETTQGGFDCTRYGFASGCGVCACSGTDPSCGCNGTCSGSNDCDNDGLKEVQVQIKTPAEPGAEYARIEQTALHSASYTGAVTISSKLNTANDGVVFVQYNGILTPVVTALYFDRNSGAGDVNADGTTDSPPNNGRDGCPGFCASDDDQDAAGQDKRAGAAYADDDGNGNCDYKSTNVGAPCTVNGNCARGSLPDGGRERRVVRPGLHGRRTSGHVRRAPPTREHLHRRQETCPGRAPALRQLARIHRLRHRRQLPGKCMNGSNTGAACTALSQCPGGYCKGPKRR